MPKKKTDGTKRKYERDEPVSLAPLDFEAALGALLKAKPEIQATQAGDKQVRQAEKKPRSATST